MLTYNLNMKKLLFLLAYVICFIICLLFADSILELAPYPYDILIWIGMLLGFVYLARNEKDSLVQIFKEVHQSNLDEIAEQEKEEANT